jgi:GNAT superfamily N-acetyltransferase
LAGGFGLAENLTVLALDLDSGPDRSAGPPPGFTWLERGSDLAETLVEDLGDFFYDGHLRHDTRPGPEAARRIWRRAALDDLAGAADEVVILWDGAGRRGAGLATARLVDGEEAALSILALAEPYWGLGLGRPLLSELIRRLKGRAGRLRAETAAYNLPALALYQALGFKPGPPLTALHLHLNY